MECAYKLLDSKNIRVDVTVDEHVTHYTLEGYTLEEAKEYFEGEQKYLATHHQDYQGNWVHNMGGVV